MKLRIRILSAVAAVILVLSAFISCDSLKNEALFDEKENFVFFINVGYGDSTLVRSGDTYVLIDTGDSDHSDMLLSALSLAGVEKLDAVFITNSNSAHAGGIEDLAKEYEIGHVYFPIHSKPNKHGEHKVEKRISRISLPYTAIDANTNKTVTVGDITFDVLGPTEFTASGDNNNSLVLKTELDGVKYLFTSDMQFTEEDLIFATGADLDCDVLLVPNHGNEDATSEEFIEKSTPKYSIISTERTEDDNSADRRVLDVVRYNGGVYYMTEDSEYGILVYAEEGEIKVLPN